jgi:hypothetical protein
MPVAEPFSFKGKGNGFNFCIPEITEADLIANYSKTYSYGSLGWCFNWFYNLYKAPFITPEDPDADPVIPEGTIWSNNISGLGEISISSPIILSEPKVNTCGGKFNPEYNLSGIFFGTPPLFSDYYEYRMRAAPTLGQLYKITDYTPVAGEPERYIFLADNSNVDDASFYFYYDAIGAAIESVGYLTMWDPDPDDEVDDPSSYTVEIDGKTFWGFSYDVVSAGTPPTFPQFSKKNEDFEFYTYP